MKTVSGFNVLDLRFSSSSTSYHEIFIKEHIVRNYDDKKPAGKTLFVLNVPPYANEKSLKNVFASAGKVKEVLLQDRISNKEDQTHKLQCGFKVAYVVFDKREGLLKALKLNSLKPLSTEINLVETGLIKWAKQYNSQICDHDELSKEVNEFMENFDKLEAQRKAKEKEGEVDDEGWTIVTRKGRNPGLARKESVTGKLALKAKLKSKKKQLKNFYTYQIRESKMKAVSELRQKYEHDKSKVEMMKKMRKFKPY